MQYLLLSFIHSYILVTIGLICFTLLNRLVNLYNLSMRKSSLASVPSIFTHIQLVEPFIFQPSLFNTKPYESITHHPFTSSNHRPILTEECVINTDTSQLVEQLELNYNLPSIEDNTSDVSTTEVSTDEQSDVIPFADMPYSKDALSTMSVQQLRDMCNQHNVKWRNANGKNKHLTKQQMINSLLG